MDVLRFVTDALHLQALESFRALGARFSSGSALRGRKGFTVIEVLTAIFVLSLLVVMIMQVIDNLSLSTGVSNRLQNSTSEARQVLDRIGVDLELMFQRQDMDYFFSNAPDSKNGAVLSFFTQVAGPESMRHASSAGPNRGISLVAYRTVPGKDGKLEMQRGLLALGAKDYFMGLLEIPGEHPLTWPPMPLDVWSVPNENFDQLAAGVFKVAVAFQINSPWKSAGGTVYEAGQALPEAPTRSLSGTDSVDIKKIGALIVAIAVLDAESRKQLSAKDLQAMADALPLPKTADEMPLQLWQPIAASGNFPKNLPRQARSAVRVYQRFYPISWLNVE